MTKQQAMARIEKAIGAAIDAGFTVVVASDPEGNSWNSIDKNTTGLQMFWGMTRDKYIAIGVDKYHDEDEVFALEDVKQY